MGGLLAEHCMMEKPSCEDLDVNKCKEADMCSWDKGKCWKTEKPSCEDLGANKCEEAEMWSWDKGKCWKTEKPSCEDLDVNKCEEAEMCSWDKGKCWKMEKNDQCWDSKRTGDKYCDHKNNNAECGWDGGDCCGDSGLKFSKNQFKDCNKESGLCDCFDPDFTQPGVNQAAANKVIVVVTAKGVATLFAEGNAAALAEATGKLASAGNSAGRGLPTAALREGLALPAIAAALVVVQFSGGGEAKRRAEEAEPGVHIFFWGLSWV